MPSNAAIVSSIAGTLLLVATIVVVMDHGSQTTGLSSTTQIDAVDSDLYTLAGFEVVTYFKCINPTCTDMWCNANCNHHPAFCPASFCKKMTSKVPVPTPPPTPPPTDAPQNGAPSCADAGKADLCDMPCESTCRGSTPGFKKAGCVGVKDCMDTPSWAEGSVCTCPPTADVPPPPPPPRSTPSCEAAGKAQLCNTPCESTCRGSAPGFKVAGCVGEDDCTSTPSWAFGSVCTCPPSTPPPAPPPTPGATPTCEAAGKADLCNEPCDSTCRGSAPGFKVAGCTGDRNCADTPSWAEGSVCTCPVPTTAPTEPPTGSSDEDSSDDDSSDESSRRRRRKKEEDSSDDDSSDDDSSDDSVCSTGDALCISNDAASYCKYWQSPSVCHGSDIACSCEASPPPPPEVPTCDHVTSPERDQAMETCPHQCTDGAMLTKEEREIQKGSVTSDECTDCFCQGCDDSLFEQNCKSPDIIRPTISSCAVPSCCPSKCLGSKFNVAPHMCKDPDCSCCAASLFSHMCHAEIPDQSLCPAHWTSPCDPSHNYMWDTTTQRCRSDVNSNFIFDQFAKTECCVPEDKAECGAASNYKWDATAERCRTDMNGNGVFDQFAKSECCVPDLPANAVCGVKNEKSTGPYYACCPESCGTCGGDTCATRPGGKDNCCGHLIAESGKSCEDNPVPCIFEPKAAAARVDEDTATGRWIHGN